ncbi:MAG: hypothetical protein ACOCVK_02075 [bacterium]
MFDTYAILSGISTYLQASIPAALTEIGKTSRISKWIIGWQHPYKMQSYDAVVLVPGAPEENLEEGTCVKPIDVYFAARSADADELAQRLIAYLDALYESVQQDDSLGGNVFVSEVADVDYVDPQMGAQALGVAVATIRAELDTLEDRNE